jgi:hypothetical protein
MNENGKWKRFPVRHHDPWCLLPACVINHRTTEQDIDFLVAQIRQTGENLLLA